MAEKREFLTEGLLDGKWSDVVELFDFDNMIAKFDGDNARIIPVQTRCSLFCGAWDRTEEPVIYLLVLFCHPCERLG